MDKMKDHPINDLSNLQKETWCSEDEAPWSKLEDTRIENMKEVYNLHRGIILALNNVLDVVSVYNLPCVNDISTCDIVPFVDEIYTHTQHTIKISFAGLILQYIITGELRYWRPYQNQEFFSDAYTISSYKDINNLKLKDKLDSFDIADYCMRQRPVMKYRCVLITQIQMFVFETSYIYILGFEPVKLLSYLTNNMSDV